MGRNLSVTCGALALLAATFRIPTAPPAARACLPVAQPAPAILAASLPGSAEFIGISISPDGRLIPAREQPPALVDALRACAGETGGSWGGDCGLYLYDYAASGRTGACALVSQTDEDREHGRMRAILVPPLPAGQAAFAVLDAQAQMVVFRRAGSRWLLVSQERAFLD